MNANKLAAAALGLIGVNLFLLPISVADANPQFSAEPAARASGGCGAKGTLAAFEAGFQPKSIIGDEQTGGGGKFGLTGGSTGSLPQSPSYEGCNGEIWVWQQCLKVNNNPLTCELYYKRHRRYFCEDGSYFCCCDGWHRDDSKTCEQAGLSCSGSPTNLPPNCTPPVPEGNYECTGCANCTAP